MQNGALSLQDAMFIEMDRRVGRWNGPEIFPWIHNFYYLRACSVPVTSVRKSNKVSADNLSLLAIS